MHSGVITQNVLMFLEDGRELRADILEEAWQRGGEGTGSNVSNLTCLGCLQPKPVIDAQGVRTVLYLFDRETFWAEAEESAARYAEEVQLPPQLPRESCWCIVADRHRRCRTLSERNV